MSGTAEATVKPVRLSEKEIARGVSYGYKDGAWVTIARPQPDGQYWIAAVDTETGALVHNDFHRMVDSKQGLSLEIGRLVRDLDKYTGLGNKMTSRSRDRQNR